MAPKLSRTSTGWQGLGVCKLVWHWVLAQNDARRQHEYTPREGRTTTSELPEHLLSAAFHLSHPPTESEAKLWHLCTPVLPFSRGKCDSLWRYTRADFSAGVFSQTLEKHITQSSCFPHREQAAGDLTVIHWYPGFTKRAESCWSCNNTSKDLESLMLIAEYFRSHLNHSNSCFKWIYSFPSF